MKKRVTWLLLVVVVALAAQTICFASSSSQNLQPKQKKAVPVSPKQKQATNAKYWVLSALFKA